jgi:hypothetical protein
LLTLELDEREQEWMGVLILSANNFNELNFSIKIYLFKHILIGNKNNFKNPFFLKRLIDKPTNVNVCTFCLGDKRTACSANGEQPSHLAVPAISKANKTVKVKSEYGEEKASSKSKLDRFEDDDENDNYNSSTDLVSTCCNSTAADMNRSNGFNYHPKKKFISNNYFN